MSTSDATVVHTYGSVPSPRCTRSPCKTFKVRQSLPVRALRQGSYRLQQVIAPSLCKSQLDKMPLYCRFVYN